jgi:hypothetical protein
MSCRWLIAVTVLLIGCASRPTVADLSTLRHDRQENDPRLRKAFAQADAYAERRTANDPPRLGEIHEYWRFKKEFLLRKYGIRWKDPSEMNPSIAFD